MAVGKWKSRKWSWKWKLETEMETNKKLLVHIHIMTGFTSHVVCLYSCTVLCDYLFSVIDLPIAEILRQQRPGIWGQANKVNDQKLEVGRALGCLATKANTWILLGLQQLRGCVSFLFLVSFPVSSFRFRFPFHFHFLLFHMPDGSNYISSYESASTS